MHGKINIVIKDKNTGEIKHSVEQKNMITDTITNLLTSCLARQKRLSESVALALNTTFVQDYLGGLMVFNQGIDLTHLIPSADEACHMIGNANQGSSITNNPHKGSLDGATISEDSAEFTWVFNADECNGTIASLCLTSNRGGELGCNIVGRDENNASDSFATYNDIAYSYDDNNMLSTGFEFDVIDADTGERSNIWGTGDSIVVRTNSDIVKVFETRGSYTVEGYENDIYEFNLKNIYNLNIPFNMITREDIAIVSKDTFLTDLDKFYSAIDSPLSNKGYAGCFYTNDDNEIMLSLLTFTTGVSKREINVNSLTQAIAADYSSHGITIDPTDIFDGIDDFNILAVDDVLLFLVGQYGYSNDFFKIYVMKSDGTFYTCNFDQPESLFLTLTDAVTKTFKGVGLGEKNTLFNIVKIFNETYLIANDYYFLLRYDELVKTLYVHAQYYMLDAYNTFGNLIEDTLSDIPYARGLGRARQPVLDAGSAQVQADYGLTINPLITAYLATICNLDTPVTKTSSDVMYITYTLSQEDQNTQTEEDI